MAANEAKIIVTAVDQASKSIDGITAKAKGMRTAFLAIGAATTAVAVVSVKAASDLEESAQAAEVTFKSAFAAVDDFANGAAGAFNLSRRAAFEYTAQLGGIFNASGLTASASAEMSVQATKLAADLASFKNLEIDVALQKIRAGLVGEVEPLRTVGVLLSAAAVEAKAMELGLADVNGELSEGAKVQARMTLIMGQLSDAQGDVARASESVANQSREMQKNMEDLRAEIGEKLLPVTAQLLDKLNGVATTMGNMPDPVINTGIAFGGILGAVSVLGLALPPVARGLSAIRTALFGAKAAVTGSTAAIASLGTSTVATGGLLAVFTGAILYLSRNAASSEEILAEWNAMLKEINDGKILEIEEQVQSATSAIELFTGVAGTSAERIAISFATIGDAVTLQMASIDNMYEGTKNNAIELQRFLADNGNLIADNAKQLAEKNKETAFAEAEAIVAASEKRYADLKTLREDDLERFFDVQDSKRKGLELLAKQQFAEFEALKATVFALPSVIPAGGITAGDDDTAVAAILAFKASQQRVTDPALMNTAAFRGEALGALITESRGGLGGAPPMLPGTAPYPVINVTVEGSVVAEDLSETITKGINEAVDQGVFAGINEGI